MSWLSRTCLCNAREAIRTESRVFSNTVLCHDAVLTQYHDTRERESPGESERNRDLTSKSLRQQQPKFAKNLQGHNFCAIMN